MNWPSTICLLTTIHSLTNALHPIIFVPGFSESALIGRIAKNADIDPDCRPEDGGSFRLYLDEKYLAKYGLKCLYAGLQLNYDSKTHTTSNRKGVEVKTLLDINLVETLDESKVIPVFKDMIKFLETKFGYKKNVSLFGAAYDFRKGPREPEIQEFCNQFKQLIINAFIKNQEQKVIIIYHSMGSVKVRLCLRGYTQQFKDKYILIIISLAGANGGAVKAIDFLTGVRFYGTEFLPDPSRGMEPSFLKHFLRKVPTNASSFELLPERTVRNFTSIPWVAPIEAAFKNQVIARTRSKNYTAQNLREYFLDLGGEQLAQIFDDAYNYTVNQPPTGVKMYCLQGYNIQTLLTINHEGDTPNSPKSYPTNGDGDGMISTQGLDCGILKRGAGDKSIVTIRFKNHNHFQFLTSKHVFQRIAEIINKETKTKQ